MPHQPKAKKRPAEAEARSLWRLAVCAVAVCVAAFIVLEPFVMDTPPGLQIFQGILTFLLWGLLTFGGTSDPPAGRE